MVVGLCGKEIRIIFGLRDEVRYRSSRPVEERGGVGHGQHAGMPFGHQDAVLVNRVGGVRRDHRVVRADRREQQVGQRIFRADGDDRFASRVELDVVIGAIAVDDLLAQRGDALATANSGDCAALRDASISLLTTTRGRGAVRIPHAEVDDVDLRGPCLGPHLVDDGEDVGGKLLDAVKLFLELRHYPLFYDGRWMEPASCASTTKRLGAEPT